MTFTLSGGALVYVQLAVRTMESASTRTTAWCYAQATILARWIADSYAIIFMLILSFIQVEYEESIVGNYVHN